MCLCAKADGFKISKKDITCYKVFCEIAKGRLITPYTLADVCGKNYKDEWMLQSDLNGMSDIRFMNKSVEIEKGMVHTFRSRKAAERKCDSFSAEYNGDVRFSVWRCVIPKDHVYVNGGNNVFEKTEYASNVIYLKEEVYHKGEIRLEGIEGIAQFVRMSFYADRKLDVTARLTASYLMDKVLGEVTPDIAVTMLQYFREGVYYRHHEDNFMNSLDMTERWVLSAYLKTMSYIPKVNKVDDIMLICLMFSMTCYPFDHLMLDDCVHLNKVQVKTMDDVRRCHEMIESHAREVTWKEVMDMSDFAYYHELEDTFKTPYEYFSFMISSGKFRSCEYDDFGLIEIMAELIAKKH